MKKIIFVILLGSLIIVSGCISAESEKSVECSWDNRENCDKSCLIDSDCKQSSCCDCINKDEFCIIHRPGEAVHFTCLEGTCKCINNKCSFSESV